MIQASSASVILNEAADEHGLYPIRTVSQLTGVNPITLRAWERRYDLIKPVRTDKGHRLYSKRDIEEIQRITQLLEQGMAISQVSPVLEQLAPVMPMVSRRPAEAAMTASAASWIEAYANALAALDEAVLDGLEAEALGFAHPDALLTQHLLPMLDGLEPSRLQDAAIDAQYRLLQTRLTRMLSQRASACAVPASAPQVLVASLPPERGVLFLWRLVWSLRREGIQARLLGGGVPVLTLVQALRTRPAHQLVLVFDHKPPLAVMGTQVPLLQESGCPVVAVGPEAWGMREALEAQGIRVSPDGSLLPLDFIRSAL